MKLKFKQLTTLGAFILPIFIYAQEPVESETTHTESRTYHPYDREDWRKNLTLSIGADAALSNAKINRKDSSTFSFSSEPRFGYGVMTGMELGVADIAGIGLGLHYLVRRFEVTGGPVKFDRTIQTLLLPLEVRFYLVKLLSFGVGGFAAFPVGKAHDSYSSGNSTIVTTGTSRNGADYGLTGSLGLNIPIGDTLGIFAEGRYLYGLTDASNSELEEKMRDFMVTAGVKVKL